MAPLASAMHQDLLRRRLDSAADARSLFFDWGIHDVERGRGNLARMAETLGGDSLAELWQPRARRLPRCPDADMALNNLERFITTAGAADRFPACSKAAAARPTPCCNCSAPASSSAHAAAAAPIMRTTPF